jgi:hypothetical protein
MNKFKSVESRKRRARSFTVVFTKKLPLYLPYSRPLMNDLEISESGAKAILGLIKTSQLCPFLTTYFLKAKLEKNRYLKIFKRG